MLSAVLRCSDELLLPRVCDRLYTEYATALDFYDPLLHILKKNVPCIFLVSKVVFLNSGPFP
jgi:hypothetical protein